MALTELQSHEHPRCLSLVMHRGYAWAHRSCAATCGPALACFPRVQLAASILHGKHPRIRTPSLDSKAPDLLPGLDEKDEVVFSCCYFRQG